FFPSHLHLPDLNSFPTRRSSDLRQQKLPIVVHTGDSHDIGDALDAGVNGIEHGSVREKIPDALFARMQANAVAYDPTLTAVEGFLATINGTLDPLERPLVLQVAPFALIESSKNFLRSDAGSKMREQLK